MTVTLTTGDWASSYIENWKKELSLSLDGGATVADLLAYLNFPEDETGMVSINGAAAERSAPLSDGDRVKIFPVIIAG